MLHNRGHAALRTGYEQGEIDVPEIGTVVTVTVDPNAMTQYYGGGIATAFMTVHLALAIVAASVVAMVATLATAGARVIVIVGEVMTTRSSSSSLGVCFWC